jgi:hypothetical protein
MTIPRAPSWTAVMAGTTIWCASFQGLLNDQWATTAISANAFLLLLTFRLLAPRRPVSVARCDGPSGGPCCQSACPICKVGPDEHCDAGLHS